VCIPAGTEIVGVAGPDGNITATYNAMALRMPMPIDAKPMDDEAALQMFKWHDDSLWHRIVYGPGVNVEAMKAKAAELASTARYPRHYAPAKG
jgi:hypothetical protein